MPKPNCKVFTVGETPSCAEARIWLTSCLSLWATAGTPQKFSIKPQMKYLSMSKRGKRWELAEGY